MNRYVSVDSSKVHTVQASIIYYADLSEIRSYDYKAQAWEKMPKVVAGYGVGGLWHNE
jgi:ribosomal protein L30E